MRVGDLICYNAGGMKYKTLGLVIEFDYEKYASDERTIKMVLVQWCIVGKFMPRRQWKDIPWNPREPINPGEFVWHELGNWLEVVK